MTKNRPALGITIGDPAGIGPEVALKALALRRLRRRVEIFLFGDQPVLKRTGVPIPDEINVIPAGVIESASFPKGKIDPLSGKASYAYLLRATSFLKEGRINGLVTAPVSKEAINLAGVPFTGHTEFLTKGFNVKDYAMVFTGGQFNLLLLTTHLPLAAVPERLSGDLLICKIRLADDFLKHRLRIRKPGILLCGLNPHAGEGGYLGNEEKTIFEPAVRTLRKEGVDIHGPIAADAAYRLYRKGKFHLLVSPYHDQLLPLFKALHFNNGVNVTIGLPFIRTSPDHGTAFDLAYQNTADSSSMEAAIRFALRLLTSSPASLAP